MSSNNKNNNNNNNDNPEIDTDHPIHKGKETLFKFVNITVTDDAVPLSTEDLLSGSSQEIEEMSKTPLSCPNCSGVDNARFFIDNLPEDVNTFGSKRLSPQREEGKKRKKLKGQNFKFNCSFCNDCFHTFKVKMKHGELHPMEISNTCRYCSKAFSFLSKKIKLEKVHVEGRPFHCGFYYYKIVHKLSSERMHEKLTVDGKTFICGCCNKIFQHLANKKAHKKNHKTEEVDTLFVVD